MTEQQIAGMISTIEAAKDRSLNTLATRLADVAFNAGRSSALAELEVARLRADVDRLASTIAEVKADAKAKANTKATPAKETP